jgi:hypothetical protein
LYPRAYSSLSRGAGDYYDPLDSLGMDNSRSYLNAGLDPGATGSGGTTGLRDTAIHNLDVGLLEERNRFLSNRR